MDQRAACLQNGTDTTQPPEPTVGWVCPLETEHVAARLVLDEEYTRAGYKRNPNDNNTYTFGRIGEHHIVIAIMPDAEYGTNTASSVVRDLVRSFTGVKIVLMVGIGGGAPLMEPGEKNPQDIRLGDVVVSTATNGRDAVFQYDYGKTIQQRAFVHTASLNRPPQSIRTAIGTLMSDFQIHKGHKIDEEIVTLLEKEDDEDLQEAYERPPDATDRLYLSSCVLEDGQEDDANDDTFIVMRPPRRESKRIKIHRGSIASGNSLMKDAVLRTTFAREKRILCFEMEAAGLAMQFDYIAIRGICDYCDTHKNDKWQGFAALTAAMFAKKLLLKLVPLQISQEKGLDGLKEAVQVIKRVEAKVTSVEEALDRVALHDLVADWLQAPDPSINHNEALKSRHALSGTWVLIRNVYVEWLAAKQRALWLFGISGCGKTVLTSTIIESLTSDKTNSEIVLYFYFDIQDARKQKLDSLLRSLIQQFCSVHEKGWARCKQLRDGCKTKSSQPTIAALRDCLLDLCRDMSVVIVLDALDEVPKNGGLRREVLSWIKFMVDNSRVQLLMTSQPAHDIKTAFEGLACCEITGRALDNDIERYIDAHLRDPNGEFKRWIPYPDVQAMITAALTGKAGGMFRLVALQLDVLRECTNLKKLKAALRTLPTGLNDMYDRIMRGIASGQHKHEAIRVLQFVAYCERPLQLSQLTDAMAVDLDERPAFNEIDRMPIPEEIVMYCPSLVHIVYKRRDRWYRSRSGEKTEWTAEVQLTHASVRAYLQLQRVENPLRIHMSESHAKDAIVQVSLAFLIAQAKILRHVISPRYIFSPDAEEMDFREFAEAHWFEMASSAEQSSEAALKWIFRFLTNGRALNSWIACRAPGKPEEPWINNWRPKTELLPLFYASLGGFIEIVKRMIDRVGSTHAVACFQESRALAAASAGGHLETVKLLISRGASIYSKPSCASLAEALWSASNGGHQAVVKLLLKHGVDINTQLGETPYPCYGGTSLHSAVGQGHEDLVVMLIRLGADINAVDDRSHTPLQMAASRGDTDIARLLILHGANLEAESEEDGTALQIAAAGGFEEIVKHLLNDGADVNSGGGYHGSPLQAAVASCSKDIISSLLDEGAFVNAQGGRHGTAIQIASGRGKLDIVEVLLAHGAEIETGKGEFEGALQRAAAAGHKEVVELLLQHGADINAAHGIYGTALQAASEEYKLEVTDVLLNRGADVASQGGKYGNALQSAVQGARNGRYEIVKVLLLARGIDVNVHGGEYGTALQAACCKGECDLVDLLLDYGAHVDAAGGKYGSALLAAIENHHPKIADLLLDHGAKFCATKTAVDMAIRSSSFRGNICAVRLLLLWFPYDGPGQHLLAISIRNTPREGRFETLCLLADCEQGRVTDMTAFRHAIFAASPANQAEVVRLFEDRLCAISEFKHDDLGRTGLHQSAAYGYLAGVEEAIFRREDLNVTDKQQWTPLHWAAYFGHSKIVKRLRESGADISKLDRQHSTAREVAIVAGHKDTAQLLERPGDSEVVVNAKDAYDDISSYRCNGCAHRLFTPGYICEDCEGSLEYYLCFRCIRDQESLHPQHRVVEFKFNLKEAASKIGALYREKVARLLGRAPAAELFGSWETDEENSQESESEDGF